MVDIIPDGQGVVNGKLKFSSHLYLSLEHRPGWAGHKDPSLPPLQSQRPSGQTSLRPTSAQSLLSGRLKSGAGPGAAG